MNMCAGLCCGRWLLRRRANKKEQRFVNQYYNTVGYSQQPEYGVAASNSSALSSLRQNLKTESMNSMPSGQTSPEEPPLLDAAAPAAAAGVAGGAAAGLTRSFSSTSSEPRGPNPNAGWLNKDMMASNPLYQGDGRTRTPSVERPRKGGRMPADTSALTGLTTQPSRGRGRVGNPDRSILDS